MSIKVRIVELPPMKVASFHHFSDSPEVTAYGKLEAWAKPRGLLNDPSRNRIFGFNNPNPSPGTPNYGYEFWLELEDDYDAGEDVEVKEIPTGKYAVTRNYGIPNIGNTWKTLVEWVQNSPSQFGNMECLEENLAPRGTDHEKLMMDIYISLAE